MVLSELVNAIAAATDIPQGRAYMHARRLQETGIVPVSKGGSNKPLIEEEHAVLILLSILSGQPLHHASAAAVRFASLENKGSTVLAYLSGMLRSVSAVDTNAVNALEELPETMLLAFRSHVSVISGDKPAVVVRYTCTDTPLETAFTEDGEPYEPDSGQFITEARSIPGTLIFRLGQAIRAARHA